MVSHTHFESEEPRRFCVVSAMHAYNAVHDFLLGSKKVYSGKLAELRTHLNRMRYGEYALDALNDQDHIRDSLQKLKIELSSAMHSLEIVDRRGYDLVQLPGFVYEPRLTEHFQVITPARQVEMINRLYSTTRGTQEKVADILEERATFLERHARDDSGRYNGFLFTLSAHYLATAVSASQKFERLGHIIRTPRNTS
ncbi:MAG: hypothetical protein AABX53_03930 [Nanoarchaeota archaeon]